MSALFDEIQWNWEITKMVRAEQMDAFIEEHKQLNFNIEHLKEENRVLREKIKGYG